MDTKTPDLSMLSRSDGQARGEIAPTRERVPLPSRKLGTRLVLPAGLVAATLCIAAYATWDALAPAVEVKVVPVISKAGQAPAGGVVVQAPGWVEADPFAHSISALTDGVVREVLVLEGQPVSAGQVVARLIEDDARLARDRADAELAAAEARLESARAALDAARLTFENTIELKRRHALSKAMLDERLADLDRWPSELAAAEAKVVELDAEHERLCALRDRQQASEIEAIRAHQQWEAQKALVESIRGRKPVLEAQVAQMRAEVDAAAESLRLKIGETKALKEAEAELKRAEAELLRARAVAAEAALRLARMEIKCPVDGIVMTRLVQPGSKVMLQTDNPQSAQIVSVYDPARLQVRVDVPLADAAQVGAGQRAEVVVNVLPDRVFAGRVTRVMHEADIQKNTLQVKVAIESPSPELKPEMLARVRFFAQATEAGDATRSALFAPDGLLERTSGSQAVAWVATPPPERAERRLVTLGPAREGTWVEVSEGLRPGDRLIAEPRAGLSPGQRVRVVGEALDVGEARGTASGGGTPTPGAAGGD